MSIRRITDEDETGFELMSSFDEGRESIGNVPSTYCGLPRPISSFYLMEVALLWGITVGNLYFSGKTSQGIE
jgi:hypothetical protein